MAYFVEDDRILRGYVCGRLGLTDEEPLPLCAATDDQSASVSPTSLRCIAAPYHIVGNTKGTHGGGAEPR